MPKINGEDWDYLVVRRDHRVIENHSFDWDEFESTIHAYTRRGYVPCGGISIVSFGSANNSLHISQSMIKKEII